MTETCKHCGAALAGTTGDRCLSCGARIDAIRSSVEPAIPTGASTPTVEPRVDTPPGNVAQAQNTPAILPSPTPPAKRSRRRLWITLGVVGALLLVVCGGCGGTLYWSITSLLPPNQTSEPVLYKSSLRDSDGAWPYSQSQCGYLTTGYLVSGGVCIASEGPFDDTDISVTVRENNGSSGGFYGIMFRQHDGQNAYIFDISTAGAWRFQKISANSLFPDTPTRQFFVLPTRDTLIHTGGAANTLFVRVTGGHFTFYANNFKLGEVDDTGGYSSGGIGLVASQGAQAVFTNLLVTHPR